MVRLVISEPTSLWRHCNVTCVRNSNGPAWVFALFLEDFLSLEKHPRTTKLLNIFAHVQNIIWRKQPKFMPDRDSSTVGRVEEMCSQGGYLTHDDVIKWKLFPRYWPFVRGIPRPPANSPHKGQWRGALMFSLIRAWINGWVNNGEAGDLRRHRAHFDFIAPCTGLLILVWRCLFPNLL